MVNETCIKASTANVNNSFEIVVVDKEIFGGAGISMLNGEKKNICELQKMYFLEEARGKGLGAKMIEDCLDKAKEFGFEACSLETMPYMEAAQKLYKKNPALSTSMRSEPG